MNARILATALILLFAADSALAATAIYKDESPDPFTAALYDGVEDTAMISRNADTRNQNFGQRINIFVADTATEIDNTVIRFDITSMAGEFAAINSVTLRLYIFSAPVETGSVDLFELLPANAAWVEGPGVASIASNNFPGSATWNELQRGTQGGAGAPDGSGILWAGGANGAGVSGTDHAVASLATYNVLGTEVANQIVDLTFNDTTMIANWVAGNNAGLVLKSTNFDNSGFGWHSSEANTANAANQVFHPELIIDYDVIPEPSRALLALLGLGLIVVRRGRV